jgi:RHS repeat-associated protein
VASTTKSSTNYATSSEYVFNGDTLLATVDQAFKNGSATGTAQTRYVHPDHLGSTNVVTNASGTVVETLDYYPYGALRISSSVGGTDSARKYIGQFADMSGLNYLQARYQNPQRGQFMSQDPTFLALGNPDQLKQISQQDQQAFLSDPQQLNSYSYARNNPISSKDPNGRSALSGGFDFSAWNFTGSAGLNFDQYGIDYYYGWGIAAGVHTGANAGITTDDLSHTSIRRGSPLPEPRARPPGRHPPVQGDL